MARWIFVTLITALLSACGPKRPPADDQTTGARWTAEQLQVFQQFKSEQFESDAGRRSAAAEAVVRSLPAAFNYDELRVIQGDGRSDPISQERLVELLGQPSVSFSLVERPEYLGANRRQLDFDPRELRIFLYDVDCLSPAAADACAYLEVVALKGNVLRARVVRDRREDAGPLLSQPQPVAPAHAPNRLLADMPRPGWKQLRPDRASELARRFAKDVLGYEIYEHEEGEAIYGRLVAPFHLAKVSENVSVCMATAEDIFVPSIARTIEDSELRRDANVLVVVIEPTLEKCKSRYREGQFVLVSGEGLAAAQLARIHDLFSRRVATECDVPAWMTPHGLVSATGGIYDIDIPTPTSGRDRWSFDVNVKFSPAKGGEYDALMAISPWGVRLKECKRH